MCTYVLCVKIIYNLYFHPLSSYPGPKLWAISRLPWNYVNFKGRLGWRIREMHQKYGPVVRIAPDELSYTTSSAWKKIYGQRSPEFEKALDGRGFAPATINGHRALMTETTAGHERLRRAINPAFSERAVREQEGYLQGHSDTLMDQLMKKSKEGVAADITRWLSLVTFDILNGEYFALRVAQ
jgi:cytochrome P450